MEKMKRVVLINALYPAEENKITNDTILRSWGTMGDSDM